MGSEMCIRDSFIDESHAASSVPLSEEAWSECPWCAGRFPQRTYKHGRGDTTTQNARTPLAELLGDRNACAPEELANPDSHGSAEAVGFTSTGSTVAGNNSTLAIAPMKIVMKILYAARLPDLTCFGRARTSRFTSQSGLPSATRSCIGWSATSTQRWIGVLSGGSATLSTTSPFIFMPMRTSPVARQPPDPLRGLTFAFVARPHAFL